MAGSGTPSRRMPPPKHMNATGHARLSPEQTYLSYVSPLLLRRRCSPAPVTPPEVERVTGAVVLIDVEHFSAFAERMSGRGGEGVEQLATRINDTFALVVEAIERHGGIAHGFPGDSVIALWLAEQRTIEEAALLAARCALELLDAHRDSELPLKAGLAAGDLHIVHAGGVDGRLQLLLSGDPLDQMGRAEERSSRGRLIVAEQAWRLLAPHAVAAVDADGFFEVKSLRPSPASPLPTAAAFPDAGIIERARAYLPAALLRQLDAGHGAWLGEFREVTTVFIEIRTRADAGNDQFARVQYAFREVQRALYRHGGDITRFAHDDKGLTVLSVFGLPPASSEDSAARAVTAALEIHRGAPPHAVRHRIGVATGRVFCGTLGAPQRREYSVVGSTPNMAARLMQSFEDGVHCDSGTMTAATPACRFERAGQLRFKGVADALDVFRPLEVVAEHDRHRIANTGAASTLVGRERERQRLHSWIGDLQARFAARQAHLLEGSHESRPGDDVPAERAGVLAVLQGEAGVGKSALVADAIEHGRGAGLEVVRVVCEAVQSSGTYAAWAKVLAALLQLHDAGSPARRTAVVLDALAAAGVSADLAPLIAPILDLALDENESTREMSGSARGDNLLALLSRLLSHLAAKRHDLGTGLMLVLEDVHWLDPASWELLGVVTRSLDGNAMGILLTMRSETAPTGTHGHGLVTAADTERITVAPLTPAETAELARRRLHAEEVSPQLVSLTYERTRGNPFFCEQLLSALVESGVVGIEAGVASLRIRNPEQAETLVPRSVAAVVTSRLDRLPAPVQLTLKAASVVGARFGLDVLRALHPMQLDEETLLAHLAAAIDIGLVEKVDGEPGTRRFRHAITCDVAYGLLLVSQRRRLHREVAEYLSRKPESAAMQAVLFYHWRRSGDEARALRHVDQAGAEAMRNGDYHSVADLYGYALQSLATQAGETAAPVEPGKPPREALWSGHLGEALVAVGMHELARPNLEMCLETLGEAPPRGSVALVLGIAGQACRQFLHRLFRRRFQGSRAMEAPRLALAAATYEQLGYVYYSCADTLRGLHAALRILNLSELAGSPDLMARSYAVMSLTTSVVGFRRLAALYDRLAVRFARETDDVLAQCYVGWVTGVRASGEAHWDLAATRLDAAQKLAEQAGHRRLMIMNLQSLAWPAYVRGDFSRAAELAEAQLAIARESNNRLWEAWGLNSLSETAVMAGNHDGAVRNCRRSLEVLSEESDRGDEIRATGLLAISLLRLSRNEEAIAVARRGLEMITRTEMTSFGMYEGFAGVCEVLLALAEETHARTHTLPGMLRRELRRATAALARFSRPFPIGRPRLHVIRARTAVLEGALATATREFDRALRAADDFGLPHEKGLALVAAARCVALDADSRRRRAEEAVGILGGGEALREARAMLEEAVW